MFLNETDKAVRDVVIHFQCETPLWFQRNAGPEM